MKSITKLIFSSLTLSSSLLLSSFYSQAYGFTLSNGTGDGSVTVGVDSFGSFGSAVNGNGTTNAFYNPVGPQNASGTTFDSAIAIGFGSNRTFLTTGAIGGSSGGTVVTPIAGTSTQANSLGNFNGLNVSLSQTLTPQFDANNMTLQTGSILTQIYSFQNVTSTPISFDVLRYLDGDLGFDGSISDGGGILGSGQNIILFETDAGGNANNANTFVGITANGGEINASNRYQISSFPGLRSSIINGNSLNNTVAGDTNGDGFINNPYDVTLALRNFFNLNPTESGTYTTQTIFGAGVPEDNTPGSSESFPLLPNQNNGQGRFVFIDVPTARWFDPPFATAFDYEILQTDLDSFFTGITFPSMVNNASTPYTLSIGGTTIGQFSAGASVDFSNLGFTNVSNFSITGINPAVDAAFGDAFPLLINFNTATNNNFSQTAITQDAPEPNVFYGLFTLVFLGGLSKIRNKK